MKLRFKDLSVWITGGGSGLGKALAEHLAREGACVAVSGRRADKLEAVAQAIRAAGGQALAVPCDVTKEEQVQAAVAQVVKAWGKLDVLVANAGYGVVGPVEKIPLAQWRQQLDVNVIGVVACVQAALPELKKTRGRIAVVSSVMGRLAMMGSAPYSTSKHALVGLCDSLYMELHGTGVSVTNILPGLVATEIGQVDNLGVMHPEYTDKRPQWLMWSAEHAAAVMADAIHSRNREYAFTFHGKVGAFLGQHVPGVLYPVMARLGVRGRG